MERPSLFIVRAVCLLLAATVAACGAAARAGPPDGRGEALVRRIEDSLGGRGAFEAVRGIRIDLGERAPRGERRWRVHLDLRAETAALRGLDGEGRVVRVTWAPSGVATVERDTEVLAGDAAADIAREARRRLDLALWGVLAPWRLRAPGVRLTVEPRRVEAADGTAAAGGVLDVLRADVPPSVAGAAAGTYRILVAPDGRPVRWSYLLDDGTRGEERWSAWAEAAGIWYAAVRLDEGRRLLSFVAAFEAEA